VEATCQGELTGLSPTEDTNPLKSTMSLPLHLRTYQEPTKEDLARTFFNLPPIDALYPPTTVATSPSPSDDDNVPELRVPVLVKQYTQSSARSVSSSANGKDGNPAAAALYSIQSMEVNAVLSVEGKDEVYVSSDVEPTALSGHIVADMVFIVTSAS
jgi:hypothetical protein